MSQRYLNTDQARQLAIHWAKTEPIVRIYIASAIGQHHLIDDIVQDVATIVTEKFEDYDPDFEFSRWAIGIAKNRIAKTIRTNRAGLKDGMLPVGETVTVQGERNADMDTYEAKVRRVIWNGEAFDVYPPG
mgnify:CR=1 FL=1